MIVWVSIVLFFVLGGVASWVSQKWYSKRLEEDAIIEREYGLHVGVEVGSDGNSSTNMEE
jgi:membrane protein implicated in regulation of membrane protease activity